MTIYSNSNISLEKFKNSYKLIIKNTSSFPGYHSYLSSNLPNITNDKLTRDKKEIIFNCENIEILNNKNKEDLTYNDLENFYINFKEMLDFLEKDKYSLLFIDINDFLLIKLEENLNMLLFINSDKFLKLQENKIEILSAFTKKNMFLSPELYKVQNIPSKINQKSIYYSIAVFISHCVNTINDIENIDFDSNNESINNTKLYFGLNRCLEKNINNRFYLFI